MSGIEVATGELVAQHLFNSRIGLGERWYVRIRNEQCLATLEIVEITDRTVVVRDSRWSGRSRYKKSDIEWIEKVKEG